MIIYCANAVCSKELKITKKQVDTKWIHGRKSGLFVCSQECSDTIPNGAIVVTRK